MHSIRRHALRKLTGPTPYTPLQSITNNSPSRRLGGHAPITVHTGMSSGNPLTLALVQGNVRNVEWINQANLQQKLSTCELLESLVKMHKDVDQTLSASRKSVIERLNAETQVILSKLTVGDYVVPIRTLRPGTMPPALDGGNAVYQPIIRGRPSWKLMNSCPLFIYLCLLTFLIASPRSDCS